MSWPARSLRSLRRRGDQGDDAGMTLVETLVAMSIFSVVLTIFMAAVISMTTSTSRVNATTDAGDGVRAAFLKLDRQVRYADAINQPVRTAAGSWYVEFRTSQRANGQPNLCTQWRFDASAQLLQFRSWNDGQVPPSTFRTITTEVFPPDASTPMFSVALADATHANQQLTVRVSSGSGSGAYAGSASMETSFVARNSSTGSPSNAPGTYVCPQATRP